jgi:hypothetical protein
VYWFYSQGASELPFLAKPTNDQEVFRERE